MTKTRELQKWVGLAQIRSTRAGNMLERPQTRRAESQAAAAKHAVITKEKTIGRIKRYLQLTTVMAAKQAGNDHAVPRMRANVSAGRPPSCHARIAAKT